MKNTHPGQTLNVDGKVTKGFGEQSIEVVPMRRVDHVIRLVLCCPRSRAKLGNNGYAISLHVSAVSPPH